MSCRVEKSTLKGRIRCPPSKSYSHRLIFAASLARGESKIGNILESDDVKATIQACKNFGAKIEKEPKSEREIAAEKKYNVKKSKRYVVTGIYPMEPTIKNTVCPTCIDAGNSGTTIRFAAAVAALANGESTLTGDKSLQKRPMGPLLEALESMGAICTSSDGKPPITVRGPIKGGNVRIRGDISSQFISAIMLIAPQTEKGVMLEIEGELVSKPYIDATIISLQTFGIKVDIQDPYKKYYIASHPYMGFRTADASPDASTRALLLSAAALIGDGLSVNIVKNELNQGDHIFTKMLEKMGVKIKYRDYEMKVISSKKLTGGTFNLRNTPDLLPPLAILALKSNKPIEIHDVAHARFKETDRISILCKELEKTGLNIMEKKDGMMLSNVDSHGNSLDLHSADFDAHGDHRLFMAFCIAGMYIGGCTVSDPESVSVSYPGFIEAMNKAKGHISI